MSTEENKRLTNQVYDAFSRGDIEGVLARIADDAVDHAMPAGVPSGKEGIRQFIAEWMGAFSDLRMKPLVLIAEGDYVAAHVQWTGRHTGTFMGHAATNKSVDLTTTEIFRIENGLMKERWATEDNLGMFSQLGLKPPAPPA